MQMKNLLCAIIFFAGIQDIRAQDELVSLLPDTSEYENLNSLQKPAVFEGFDLFTMIDGGAEVYFEYGFDKALSMAYLADSTERIEIQVYKMNDVAAAYGILSHTRVKSDRVKASGGTLLISNDYYQMFQRDRYFVVISWSNPSEKMAHLGNRIALEIAGHISDPGELPEDIRVLLEQGYAHQQIKFVRGTIGLSSVYFFSHKDIFAVEEAIVTENETETKIIFCYKDPQKATTLFPGIRAEFEDSTRVTGFIDEAESIRFTDRKGRQVKISKEEDHLKILITSS